MVGGGGPSTGLAPSFLGGGGPEGRGGLVSLDAVSSGLFPCCLPGAEGGEPFVDEVVVGGAFFAVGGEGEAEVEAEGDGPFALDDGAGGEGAFFAVGGDD